MTRKPPLPAWIEQARAGWKYRGSARPAFATEPGPGQESVWDYPRPPVIVRDARRVTIKLGDIVIADTHSAFRLLETSHPPTWYLPRCDVDSKYVIAVGHGSFCEWKGQATYYDVVAGKARLSRVAWSYPNVIDESYESIAGALAFYATDLECLVDGERVTPQPGGFYGGWITKDIVGPWKGDPGTGAW
jgi:uncharacterized protein (DUF427 family)